MRTLQTLLVMALVSLTATAGHAQRPVQRKPLRLNLFLRPFKPQTVTPQLFGLLPENAYLQKEIKLTAAQKERMRQIERQLTRVSTVLREKDVQKELGLSKSQRQRIEKQRSATRKKFKKLSAEWAKLKKNKKRPRRKDLAAFRKRGEEIDAEHDKAALNELTRRQRARFATLMGKAVDPAKIFNRRSFRVSGLEVARLTRPFKPQTGTPRVFGHASYNEYVQQELKITRKQKRRMREIEIQLTRASFVLVEKDVRKQLSLSDKQIRRIRQMRTQYLAKSSELLDNLRKQLLAAGDDAKALQKLSKEGRAIVYASKELIGRKLDNAVIDTLTQKQQKKLGRIKGVSVDPTRIFHYGNSAKLKRPDV